MPDRHSLNHLHSFNRRAAQIQQIDDDDTKSIIYSGRWAKSGGASEFRRTTHATRTPGASATFKFTGTSVRVLGSIGKTDADLGAVSSSYILDGGRPVLFTAPVNAGVPRYNQEFFSSTSLPNREHTLTIMFNTGSNFYLDLIEVITQTDPVTTTVTSVSATSTSTGPVDTRVPLTTGSSTSDTSRSISTTASATKTPASLTGSSVVKSTSTTGSLGAASTSGAANEVNGAAKTTNTGVIAGVTAGVALLIVIAMFFCIKKWRSEKKLRDPINFGPNLMDDKASISGASVAHPTPQPPVAPYASQQRPASPASYRNEPYSTGAYQPHEANYGQGAGYDYTNYSSGHNYGQAQAPYQHQQQYYGNEPQTYGYGHNQPSQYYTGHVPAQPAPAPAPAPQQYSQYSEYVNVERAHVPSASPPPPPQPSYLQYNAAPAVAGPSGGDGSVSLMYSPPTGDRKTRLSVGGVTSAADNASSESSSTTALGYARENKGGMRVVSPAGEDSADPPPQYSMQSGSR